MLYLYMYVVSPLLYHSFVIFNTKNVIEHYGVYLMTYTPQQK